MYFLSRGKYYLQVLITPYGQTITSPMTESYVRRVKCNYLALYPISFGVLGDRVRLIRTEVLEQRGTPT